MSPYAPPYPPYDPTDKSGFSYETVTKRWPIILTSLIDTIYNENMGSSRMVDGTEDQIRDKATEGKKIIQELSKLKYEMGHDRPLESLLDDGGPNIREFNSQLAILCEQGKNTWFSAPWLYAECYLYRLVRTYFSTTTFWKDYDPFRAQKEKTFSSSASAIFQLAHTFAELDIEKHTLKTDHLKLEVLFNEMLQMCLWGNATDLSLLTNMTHEDIQKLQSVGRAAQKERKEFILLDNSAPAWKQLSDVKDGRVDIVLDNAGFELFTDLLLADFLLTYTPYVSRVVFHPKSVPWFVSDVLPSDFRAIFESLLDLSFFCDYSPSPGQRAELDALIARWQEHLSSGQFSLSIPLDSKIGETNPLVDFWTSPSPFAVMMEEAPELTQVLEDSALVIFKAGRPQVMFTRSYNAMSAVLTLLHPSGTISYRKLTADVKWPPSTPFHVALGPLAGVFPTLSLRTLKADVAVGLKDRAAELDAKDAKWRVNGKYALISFHA